MVINCAMSADGKIALPDGRQTRISSDRDMAHVHRLRNWADAIMVGANTVLTDDPGLTVKKKHVPGPEHRHRAFFGRDTDNPLRVVADSRGRTPPGSYILDDAAFTVIAVSRGRSPPFPLPDNVVILDCGSGEHVDLVSLLGSLRDMGVRRLMVEGGGSLIASFLRAGLADEFQIFMGDMVIGGEHAPTPVMGDGAADLRGIGALRREAVFEMDGGIRVHYEVL